MHTDTLWRGLWLVLALAIAPGAFAQEPVVEEHEAPDALSTLAVPLPENLGDFVVNEEAAILLGKALFWDVQVGSDGQVACATCHYHAGADHRTKNTVNPGPDGEFDIVGEPGDCVDGLSFLNPREASIDDVVGSQGVRKKDFEGINMAPGAIVDCGLAVMDETFLAQRQVTGRQAPTVINAVFNHRNFWDGRAQNDFNGVDPFGSRNSDAYVHCVVDGAIEQESISLKDASLASQAVGPVNSEIEMAWSGRAFRDVAKKLFALRPLAQQRVAADDGVLGPYVHMSGFGLDADYLIMVKDAFNSKYWDSMELFNEAGDVDPAGTYSLAEQNFSLFWGLAVMMYEATLVSDDTPYDAYALGDDSALTDQEKKGLDVFLNEGKCINCHEGPEFTGATITQLGSGASGDLLETSIIEDMIMGDGNQAFYDSGFYNIGVRPTAEDIGLGGVDPWGKPLSFTRLDKQGNVNGDCHEDLICSISGDARVAVDGSFKTPTLRNIELTGPYFHSGRYATLESVVDFYLRRGDSTKLADGSGDTTGTGPLGEGGSGGSNLDADIERLELDNTDSLALVAFMKALTDERVRYEEAPFDHPELVLPNGDLLPAVGAGGLSALGLAPINTFAEELAEDCSTFGPDPDVFTSCDVEGDEGLVITKVWYNVDRARWIVKGNVDTVAGQAITAYLGESDGPMIGSTVVGDTYFEIIPGDAVGPDAHPDTTATYITVVTSLGTEVQMPIVFRGL